MRKKVVCVLVVSALVLLTCALPASAASPFSIGPITVAPARATTSQHPVRVLGTTTAAPVPGVRPLAIVTWQPLRGTGPSTTVYCYR